MPSLNNVTTYIPAERKSEYVPEKLTFFLADRRITGGTVLASIGYREITLMNMETGYSSYLEIAEEHRSAHDAPLYLDYEYPERLPLAFTKLFTNYRPVPAGTTITFN